LGAQIVAPFEFFAAGSIIVRHHHERWDGSGYPDGLRGAAIPLGARIVAVADVYDALTSTRPYREALPHHVAIEHIVGEAGRTRTATSGPPLPPPRVVNSPSTPDTAPLAPPPRPFRGAPGGRLATPRPAPRL